MIFWIILGILFCVLLYSIHLSSKPKDEIHIEPLCDICKVRESCEKYLQNRK